MSKPAPTHRRDRGGGLARHLARRARGVSRALLDQSVWSLTGFVATALVGRFLGAEALGIYAIGLAFLFGAGGVLNSLFVDPAAVLGPRHFERDLRTYAGNLLLGGFGFGMLLAVVGLMVGLFWRHPTGEAIGAALLISPLVFVAWGARRLPYLTSEPGMALTGSLVYLLVTVAGILAAQGLGVLSVVAVYWVMAVACGLQAAVVLRLWKPSLAGVRDQSFWFSILRAHWGYGKWLLAAESSSWVLNYGFAGLTAATVDLASAGGYRAAQSLLRPYGIVFVAMGMLFLPRLAASVRDAGPNASRRFVAEMGAALSVLGLAVFLVLLLLGGPIMELVFGPEFTTFGWLVAVLAGAQIVHGWIVGFSMALQAAERPRAVFYGQAASATVAVVLGFGLGLPFGLAGLAGAAVIATVVRALVVGRLYVRLLREFAT